MPNAIVLVGEVGRLITLDPQIQNTTLATLAGATAYLVNVPSSTKVRTQIPLTVTNDGERLQRLQQATDFAPGGLTTWQLVVTTADGSIYHSPEIELVIGSAL